MQAGAAGKLDRTIQRNVYNAWEEMDGNLNSFWNTDRENSNVILMMFYLQPGHMQIIHPTQAVNIYNTSPNNY